MCVRGAVWLARDFFGAVRTRIWRCGDEIEPKVSCRFHGVVAMCGGRCCGH